MASRKSEKSLPQTKDDAESIYQDMRDDRNFFATSLSTNARTITLSVLALVWLLVAAGEAGFRKQFDGHSDTLIWLAFFCVAILLVDYLQYVAGYFEADSAAKNASDALQQGRYNDVAYQKSSVLSMFAQICFYLKVVSTIVAAGWLCVVIYKVIA